MPLSTFLASNRNSVRLQDSEIDDLDYKFSEGTPHTSSPVQTNTGMFSFCSW